MAISDEQITKLFKVRRTVLEMLRDRGYTVEHSDLVMTRPQFVEKYGTVSGLKREDLFIHTSKGEGPSNQIYVFFPESQKVGVPMVKSYAKKLKADNILNAILVVQTGLTAPAKAAIQEISAYFRIDVFEDAELLCNITEHALVPKHTVLTDEEKKELLKKYRIKETQLPRILVTTDPVARYYGLKRGQVVKIIRQSVTADTYVTYRFGV